MLFEKKIMVNEVRLKRIEDRLKKLECDHTHDHVFSLHNSGQYWKRECGNCRGMIARYDNEKDYLMAKNAYMVELIDENEKIILGIRGE